MTEGYLAVSPAAGRHAYPNLCCSVGSDPRGFDALNHPYHQQHCIDNAIVASGKRRRPCQRRMRHPVRSPSGRGGSRSRSCWRGGLTLKICDVMTQGKRAGQRWWDRSHAHPWAAPDCLQLLATIMCVSATIKKRLGLVAGDNAGGLLSNPQSTRGQSKTHTCVGSSFILILLGEVCTQTIVCCQVNRHLHRV